jgi:phospholipase/lecithinase/hemolysin
MCNSTLRIALILLVFVLQRHHIYTQKIPFISVVSFGDSNTDTGNVYKLSNYSWPPVSPYYQGRLTNGPTWVERLDVSRLIDYAYEGSSIDDKVVQGWGVMDKQLVPGVRQQIGIYFNETHRDTINFDQTIYIIWAGLNDYCFNETISPSTIATSLLNAVKDLVTIGVLHLLVFNQPPLQSYPFIPIMNQSLNFTAFTIQLNANLSTGVATLQHDNPKISLKIFDLYSLISKIIANGCAYSFKNTVDPCLNITKIGVVLRQCIDPASYVFFDEYHFASHVHELIAHDVRQLFSSSSHISYSSYSMLVLFCWMLLSLFTEI